MHWLVARQAAADSWSASSGLSVQNFIADPTGMHHYTGPTNYENFKFVLQTLDLAVYSLNYIHSVTPVIDIEDQLRRHATNFGLSRQFGPTESVCLWGEIGAWPS